MELINNPNDIQINEQQEIQQIMGEPPAWIVRWGISLVMISVTALFLIAYFVRYPDAVPAEIVLETENPPIRVPARVGGKIEQLRVSEGENVTTGQLLAVLENTADLSDIDRLTELTAGTEPSEVNARMQLPDNLSVGELQDSWSAFAESHRDYRYFRRKDKTSRKADILRRQIEENEDLRRVLERRKISLQEEKNLKTAELNRTQTLQKEGLASVKELENAQASLVLVNRQIADIESEFINNNIAIEQLRRSILDLGETKDLTDNTKQIRMQENFQRLKSELAAWKLNFLLTAPINGTVTFYKPLSENEYISSGDEVMTVVPPGESSGEIKGYATLPFEGAGKVQVGQKVNIRLADFPYQEFGIVRGTVSNIALVPLQNNYLVEVALPQGLESSYNRRLPFRQQMAGAAQIITEERRYLSRILDKVISAWRNR